MWTPSKAAVSRRSFWTGFLRDRRGVVGVAVAVFLPVLVGFAGIGIEVGLWFAIQRQNQSAADAAAISAGLEYAAQIEQPRITTNPNAAATTAANCNLFSTSSSSSNPVCPLPSSASNTITLYPCYDFAVGGSCNTSSSNGAQPNAVKVALTQPLNTTFANFVTAIWGPNINTINVTTTATAAFSQTNPACLLALDPRAASAVSVNTGTLQNPNCWVAANSSSASALNCNNCTITGPTTAVGGDAVSNGGQLNGSPNRTYASAIADPYAATLTHAFLIGGMPPTVCKPAVVGQTYTYPPNCLIPGGQPLPGNATILSPGTYWVTDGNLTLAGTLTCQGCLPGGRGVTIIFTTIQGSAGTIGTPLLSGNPTITLNAPGSGLNNAGLLMIQDTVLGVKPNDGGQIVSPSATLSGLLYFPKTSLNFTGTVHTDPSNCLVVVADGLSLNGNIGLNDSGCPTAGPATPPTILSVFLVYEPGA
jgi:Flp pilus assembly protein TadG